MAFDPVDVTPVDGLDPWPPERVAVFLRAAREQLLGNTQARAWPAMANTRRFSHPDR